MRLKLDDPDTYKIVRVGDAVLCNSLGSTHTTRPYSAVVRCVHLRNKKLCLDRDDPCIGGGCKKSWGVSADGWNRTWVDVIGTTAGIKKEKAAELSKMLSSIREDIKKLRRELKEGL